MKYFIIILLMFAGVHSHAQDGKYKALFIYKFIQNFEYPQGKIGDQHTIGVLGSDDVFDQLTRLTEGRKINGKPIVVVKYTPGSSMAGLSALFLSNKSKDLFESLNKIAMSSSTAVVGETPGLGSKGACVNFTTIQGKLGFELNMNSFEAVNIQVSSSLKSLGKLVN